MMILLCCIYMEDVTPECVSLNSVAFVLAVYALFPKGEARCFNCF